MYFNAKISVTITNQTTGRQQALQTVVSVATRNDSKDIGSTCDLVVPLNCRIQYQDGKRDFLTGQVKVLFKSGDPILITAHYVGYDPVTVFSGFIHEFIEGTPMTIKCMDAIYLLDQTTVDIEHKTITLQNLVTGILKGTGITLMLPTMQLVLTNITFRLMSPAAILEYIKKEIGLNISLSGTQLYINVASNTLDQAILRTDTNVIKSDLQKPDAVFQKLKVKAWFINQNGTKSSLEVGDPEGHLREVFFYKIPADLATYKRLAEEALIKYKQMKYSGNIETLLYPFCDLFWKVRYTDIRYPDRTGNYTIVGIDHEINEKGYHKKIKMAYLSDII